MKNVLAGTRFINSAMHPREFAADCGCELAVIGRSNCGKSSAINALCNNKKLARTGKSPGRTRTVNFFAVAAEKRLADLPGYGYAKAGAQIREKWDRLMHDYFTSRRSLRCIFLIADIRRALGGMDAELIGWLNSVRPGLALHVVLAKSDKLAHSAAVQTLKDTTDWLGENTHGQASAQIFSAHKSVGVPEARRRIAEHLLL